MIKRTPPNSATLYEKRFPREPINMKFFGISHFNSYICEYKIIDMSVTKPKFTEKQELVAKFGNALANPVRVAILELLSNQSCCFHGDMADELPIAKSTLSQHLKVLKEAGLIQGEINPPKTKYCINKENWALAKGLMIGFFS